MCVCQFMTLLPKQTSFYWLSTKIKRCFFSLSYTATFLFLDVNILSCGFDLYIVAFICKVWSVVMIKRLFAFSPCFSNDSFEGEPEEKRRKTTNVVIDQPATEHKVLIDNVPDNSSLLEEVRHQKQITRVKSSPSLIAINELNDNPEWVTLITHVCVCVCRHMSGL